MVVPVENIVVAFIGRTSICEANWSRASRCMEAQHSGETSSVISWDLMSCTSAGIIFTIFSPFFHHFFTIFTCSEHVLCATWKILETFARACDLTRHFASLCERKEQEDVEGVLTGFTKIWKIWKIWQKETFHRFPKHPKTPVRRLVSESPAVSENRTFF